MAALKANNVTVGARVQSSAYFSGDQFSRDKEGKQRVATELTSCLLSEGFKLEKLPVLLCGQVFP